ncbi:MAG: hypothetical protein V1781_09470 [Bacteroidota bacterium]
MKKSTHIASTFYFLLTHKANAGKNKKRLQVNAPSQSNYGTDGTTEK